MKPGNEKMGGDKVEPFSILFSSVLLFNLLGISLISSIALLTVFATCSIFGRQVSQLCKLNDSIYQPGITIGLGVVALFPPMLLTLGFSPFLSNYLPIIGMLLLVKFSNKYVQVSTNLMQQSSGVFVPLVVAILVAATWHSWLLPFAMAALLIQVSSRRFGAMSLRVLFVCVIMSAGWWVSRSIRPEYWWYFWQSNDLGFLESLSWSLTEWGFKEHPGLSAGSVTSYHWLSYSLMGSLSHVSGLAPWEGLVKLGPPLLGFLLSQFVFKSRDSNKPIEGLTQIVTVALAVRGAGIFRFDSFGFSLVVALSFLTLTSIMHRDSHKRLIVLLTFLSVMLVLSKASTAVVVLVILLFWAALDLVRKGSLNFAPLIVLSVVSATIYLTLFRGSPASTLLRVGSFDFSNSIVELRNLLENPGFVAQVMIIGIAIVLKGKSGFKISNFQWSLTIVSVCGLLYHLLFPTVISGYFGLPALTLSTLMAQNWYLKVRNGAIEQVFHRNLKLIFAISIAIGIGLNYEHLLRVSIRSFGIQPQEDSPIWLIVQGSGFVVLISQFVILASVIKSRKALVAQVFSLVLVFGFIMGSGIHSYQNILKYGAGNYTNWSGNSSPFGSGELIALSSYIRENTSPSALLASNNFCCDGAAWWSQMINESENDQRVFGTEHMWGGANYLLPAETRRRFLIQGPRFQIGGGRPTEEQTRRMRVSLGFASSPSTALLNDLRNYGVSGFVVNLDLTDNRSWSGFAIEEFRAGNFVYLRLPSV